MTPDGAAETAEQEGSDNRQGDAAPADVCNAEPASTELNFYRLIPP